MITPIGRTEFSTADEQSRTHSRVAAMLHRSAGGKHLLVPMVVLHVLVHAHTKEQGGRFMATRVPNSSGCPPRGLSSYIELAPSVPGSRPRGSLAAHDTVTASGLRLHAPGVVLHVPVHAACIEAVQYGSHAAQSDPCGHAAEQPCCIVRRPT